MSTSRTETAPGTWDDARDARFFRMTAHLFTADFCLGATVLLASYDDDEPGTGHHDAAPAVALRVRDERTAVQASQVRGAAA